MINPILEIRDKNGAILYQKKVEKTKTSLEPGVASLVWDILSQAGNMPSGWVNYYAVRGLKYAVKSGTSNKVITENGKERSVPRDGWLATYTPSRVTMYWAGNADDKPMNKNALGLLLNSEVNKSFYGAMLAQGHIKNEEMAVIPGKQVTISKITGRTATEATPEEFKVSTIGFNTAIPADGAYTSITVDNACGGKVSPLTPPEQRQKALLFQPVSITSLDTQDIIKWYGEQNKMLSDYNNVYARLFPQEPTEYCEGRAVQESDAVQVTTSLTKNQAVAEKFVVAFGASSSQ